MRWTKFVPPVLVALLLLLVAGACGGGGAAPTPTPTPTPTSPPTPTRTATPTLAPTRTHDITLADAPRILDMSSDLPARFEHLDAAHEGVSNSDLGLGPGFSEVELFLSEDPFQMVVAYMTVVESQVERAATDAFMKDEDQVRSAILWGFETVAVEEDIEWSEIAEIHISYPSIGDLAVFGTGQVNAYGLNIAYDLLLFKNAEVYVTVAEYYLPGNALPLIPLAEAMNQRIVALAYS